MLIPVLMILWLSLALALPTIAGGWGSILASVPLVLIYGVLPGVASYLLLFPRTTKQSYAGLGLALILTVSFFATA